MQKKNKSTFYIIAIITSCILIFGIAFLAAISQPQKTDYLKEYGGNPEVYQRLALETNCSALQNEFNTAEENLGTPGTPQYQWGLGYMKAADDRMREIGCYP